LLINVLTPKEFLNGDKGELKAFLEQLKEDDIID